MSGPSRTARTAGSGIRPLRKLVTVGHSYVAGTGATNSANRWSTKLAEALHVTEVNRGVGGARAALSGITQGGYAQALSQETRARQAAPYLPSSAVVPIMLGVNDWNDYSVMARFQHALRTTISRYRAAAIFEETHASIAYTGTWAQAGAAAYNSGSACKQCATGTVAGSSFVITVPADFPGGTIAAGFTLVDDVNSFSTNGVYSFSVDGGAAQTMDTRGLGITGAGASANFLGAVMRLTGLSAGAHTVTVTFPTPPNSVFFDYWQIEAKAPPLILLLKQPVLDATGYATYATPTLTDARIATLNAGLDALAAEFTDGLVKTVDLSVLDNSFSKGYMASDHLHPNEVGHALIAQAAYNAILAAPVPDATWFASV